MFLFFSHICIIIFLGKMDPLVAELSQIRSLLFDIFGFPRDIIVDSNLTRRDRPARHQCAVACDKRFEAKDLWPHFEQEMKEEMERSRKKLEVCNSFFLMYFLVLMNYLSLF